MVRNFKSAEKQQFDMHFMFLSHRKKEDYKKQVLAQQFKRERLVALGPDLSAAHFLIARGCKVRFRDQDKWLKQTEIGKYPKELPLSYEAGYYVEAIDASDSSLIYEGITSIRNLVFLKHLNLSYCMNIDAWCMDRITGE